MAQEILAVTEKLSKHLFLRAQEVDEEMLLPTPNLEAIAQSGYYRLVVEASPGQRRRALDLLSAGCGVTAFLSTQHEGVCRRLREAEHPLLESALSGKVWFGVCFAHLRREISPVSALEFKDHIVFSGHGPWFSGYGIMQMVLVGGACESGDFLMGLADMDEPEIVARPLERLNVMNATATVGLDLNALRVESKDLVVRINAPLLDEQDVHSTVFQSARSLGAARAAARFLPESQERAVLEQIAHHHRAMDAWDQAPDPERSTGLRFEALQLAARVVGAAYASVGGKAHLCSHPLQRIAREAHFYATTQLTRPLRDRVLESLTPK